jgi:hypothetical protein
MRAGSAESLAGAEITLAPAPTIPGNPSVRLVVQPNVPAELRDAVIQAVGNITVVNGVPVLSGAPVANGAPVPVGTPAARTFNAVADAAGRFEIPNVPPGNYTLTARMDGFVGPAGANGVSPTGASRNITIAAGQETAAMTLTLVRGGTVEGRILRSDGKPASGATVTPYLLTYRDGRRTMIAGGNSRTTDDRGQYRIFWLGPGEYIIGAAARPAGGTASQADPGIRTYFPGTLDPSVAASISIGEDPGVTNIDFEIQTGGSFSIRGRAINPLPLAAPRTLPSGDADTSIPAFALVPRDGAIEEYVPRQIQNAVTSEAGRRNGDFEIRGVRPGLYDLFPLVNVVLNGQPRMASGRIPVEVKNQDVDGVSITAGPGVELAGRFKVEGDSIPVKLDTLRVTLAPLDNIPAPIPARIAATSDSGGSWVLRNVPEARYTLVVTTLPPNLYVADIRQNGASVFDSGITIRKDAPGPVEVVLNTDGQTLEGVVIGGKDLPVPGATVVLIPPPARRQNPVLYRSVRADTEGRFKITGVAAGDYKVFAWANVLSTAWLNAPFLARYESQGRNITVRAGSNPNLRLQAVSNR